MCASSSAICLAAYSTARLRGSYASPRIWRSSPQPSSRSRAGWVPWFTVPLLSLVIGACFAGLTFVGHEPLHGGDRARPRWRHVVGWIGFLPFALSPRLWIAWHNRVHHAQREPRRRSRQLPDARAVPRAPAARGSRSMRSRSAARRWRGVLSLVARVHRAERAISCYVARRRGFFTHAPAPARARRDRRSRSRCGPSSPRSSASCRFCSCSCCRCWSPTCS